MLDSFNRFRVENVDYSNACIGVVGLGYVGLPTALAFHSAGFRVIGIDYSKSVIDALKSGKSHLRDDSVEIEIPPISEKWSVTNDYDVSIPECDVVLITVPTPVRDDKSPDLSFVESASKSVISNLGRGKKTVVVLQSTVYPGVTRKILGDLCGKIDPQLDIDVVLAYSPERVDPGDSMRSVSGVSQIVGCDNKKDGVWLSGLFDQITSEEAVFVGSIEVAEASKLIENVQRDIDIAFANELSRVLPLMGIDVEQVLDAASTKWNFHRHSPGIGVGGHCIPVDPYYYIEIAEKLGQPSIISEAARRINSAMPKHSAKEIEGVFHDGLENKRVLVLGYSYKPNVGDSRETPVKFLIEELRDKGAEILVHDPLVEPREIPSWATSVDGKLKCRNVDIIVLATSHRGFDYSNGVFWRKLESVVRKKEIFDGRRFLPAEKMIADGWSYNGIGFPNT